MRPTTARCVGVLSSLRCQEHTQQQQKKAPHENDLLGVASTYKNPFRVHFIVHILARIFSKEKKDDVVFFSGKLQHIA